MRALVTGGAGFIGSNLTSLLVENNVEVRILDSLTTGYKENLKNLSVDFVKGDVRDFDLVMKCVKDIDVIFHLAASIGNVKSLKDPKEDCAVNALGTINILEAACKSGVKKIVYSSSAATYGTLIEMPITENHPQNPDSPYGVSKLAAEKYVLCFGKLYNLQAICLRYFNVYGVHQRYDAYGNVIPIFANRLKNGEPIIIYGDGEQTRDFVNVKDVAAANFLAALSPIQYAVYNIGSGTQLTINDLTKFVQETSGIKATSIKYWPPRPSEVIHCKADIRKAASELGFNPTVKIKDGLTDYFSWFMNSN